MVPNGDGTREVGFSARRGPAELRESPAKDGAALRGAPKVINFRCSVPRILIAAHSPTGAPQDLQQEVRTVAKSKPKATSKGPGKRLTPAARKPAAKPKPAAKKPVVKKSAPARPLAAKAAPVKGMSTRTAKKKVTMVKGGSKQPVRKKTPAKPAVPAKAAAGKPAKRLAPVQKVPSKKSVVRATRPAKATARKPEPQRKAPAKIKAAPAPAAKITPRKATPPKAALPTVKAPPAVKPAPPTPAPKTKPAPKNSAAPKAAPAPRQPPVAVAAKPAPTTKPAPAGSPAPAPVPALPEAAKPKAAKSTPGRAGIAKPAATKTEKVVVRKVTNLDDVKLPEGYKPSPTEEYMNPMHLAYFKKKLETWREELLEQSHETVLNLRTETRDVGDEVERANREADNILELRTRDRERKLLRKIEEALKRIEDGSYGYCEETGDEIGLGRLDANPRATLTVDAQERREAMQRQFRDDR